MTKKYIKKIFYITKEQNKKLKLLAKKDKASQSDFIRVMINNL